MALSRKDIRKFLEDESLSLDNHTRDSQIALVDERKELSEPFSNGLMYPADPAGDPAEVYNCRCTMLSYMPDVSEDDRRETYNEWMSRKNAEERERETEYGVPYGEYSIGWDREYFDSDDFRNKFNITNNSDVNENLYKLSRECVLDNYGTKYESMYLLDAENGGIISSITDIKDKREQGVSYTDQFRRELEKAINSGKKIISIHNHPEGYPPSADDFRKAYENRLQFGLAIGGNGQVYQYANSNLKLLEKDCDNIHSEINSLYRGGFDIDNAYKTIYDLYGLKYKILRGG